LLCRCLILFYVSSSSQLVKIRCTYEVYCTHLRKYSLLCGAIRTNSWHFVHLQIHTCDTLYSISELIMTRLIIRGTLKTDTLNALATYESFNQLLVSIRSNALFWVLSFPFRINLPGTEPSHQRQGVPTGRVSLAFLWRCKTNLLLKKKNKKTKKKTSIRQCFLFHCKKYFF